MKMVAGARFGRAAAREERCPLYYQAELEKVSDAYLSLLGAGRRGRLVFPLPLSLGDRANACREGRRSWLWQPTRDSAAISTTPSSVPPTASSRKTAKSQAVLIAVGRKSVEHYRNSKVPVKTEHAQFFNRFDFGMADTIGQEADQPLPRQRARRTRGRPQSLQIHDQAGVHRLRLLPIEPMAPSDTLYRCTITEPVEEQEILQTLLPMYLKARFTAFSAIPLRPSLPPACGPWTMRRATPARSSIPLPWK